MQNKRIPEEALELHTDEFDKSAHVYTAIKDLVVGRSLEPGSHINLQDLAAQLRVSRTPIREALIRLSCEELVEMVPATGFFVRPRLLKELKADYEYAYMILRYSIEKGLASFSLEGLRRPMGFGSKIEDPSSSLMHTMFLEGLYDRVASIADNLNALKAIRLFNDRTTFYREKNLRHRERGPAILACAQELATTLQTHQVDSSIAALKRLFDLASIYLGDLEP